MSMDEVLKLLKIFFIFTHTVFPVNVTVKKLTNNRCCYAPPISAVELHTLNGENFNKIFIKFDLPSVEQPKKKCAGKILHVFSYLNWKITSREGLLE